MARTYEEIMADLAKRDQAAESKRNAARLAVRRAIASKRKAPK